MITNISENFPFDFQGLDLQTKTISLSKVGEFGAKVTSLENMTRFNLNMTFARGEAMDVDVHHEQSAKGVYTIVPLWGLELSKGSTIECVFRWSTDNMVLIEQFNVVD